MNNDEYINLIKRDNDLIRIEQLVVDDLKPEEIEIIIKIYKEGLEKLKQSINELKDIINQYYGYSAIKEISGRIKTPESIKNKMKKKDYLMTYKSMVENVNDIAGMRIICNSKKDIYTIKELIKQMPEIKVLQEKDYIKQKKKSGYTAYHLIVETPVKVKETLILVKVEIQIRTELMDFWASAEHKIKYKTNKKLSYLDSKKMCIYAKKINQLEDRIMKIYQKQIEK